jgi:hypothetical protein
MGKFSSDRAVQEYADEVSAITDAHHSLAADKGSHNGQIWSVEPEPLPAKAAHGQAVVDVVSAVEKK